jgi:hypothetical protein
MDSRSVRVAPRSVRVAIERDALTQALSLQEELQTLVNTVKQLCTNKV